MNFLLNSLIFLFFNYFNLFHLFQIPQSFKSILFTFLFNLFSKIGYLLYFPIIYCKVLAHY